MEAQAPIAPDDRRLVEALRAGDEAAFAALVDRYHASLVRLALVYVPSRAIAEEVVQETWLAVLEGVGRFEGRSSLKTWIYRILTNVARTRARREGRTLPFSALGEAGGEEGAVDADRFDPGSRQWRSPPRPWDLPGDERAVGAETMDVLARAIGALPEVQRTVIVLRDVDGWDAGEVCNALDLSATNQRVLLHRARAKVRTALERYRDG